MGCGCKSGSSNKRSLVKRSAPRDSRPSRGSSSNGRIIKRIIK